MKRNYILALASAFILWLAWPPMPYTSLLLLVGFVPLLRTVENLIDTGYPGTGKKVFLLSFLSFFLWNTASIYWVYNSVSSVLPSWIAILISLIPYALGASLMALVFWLYYQLRKRSAKRWAYPGLICFWIGYEFLHQSWDLAFPWMTLGNGFALSHQLVQWYEYTGVFGGTLWIWIANILAFELSMQQETSPQALKFKKKYSLVLALWVLLPLTISLIIYSSYKEKPNPANVVVVQPNLDPYERWRSISKSEQLEQLIRLSDSLGQANTEYFIWPETAISEQTNEEQIHHNASFLAVQSFLSKYKNGNLLSGIESYLIYESPKTPTAKPLQDGRYWDYFNAAVNIENSSRVQFYHKSKLVPGVEMLPFAGTLAFMKPVFAAFGGSSGGVGRQEKPSVFYSQSGIGAAPVICYESIWGEYVSNYVEQGAQFIAIVTNDGWWGNTSGKDQHMLYAKLRAIETRRWVARSANTGISCFINQKGDITQKTKWWVATALKEDINLNDKITFYTAYGDYIARTATVGSLLFILFMLFKVFRDRKTRRLVPRR